MTKNEANGCNGTNHLLAEEESSGKLIVEQSTKPLQNSVYCMLTLFLSVSSVMLSTGISVGSLNPGMVLLQGFYNETYQGRYNENISPENQTLLIALTVSMLFAGGFIGALSIGFVLALFSRKNAMIVMNITNLISVVLLSLGGWLIPAYEAIIIGRFIMGLFCGFGMNLIPIVVAETCVQARQPFYLSLIGVNLSLGGLIGLCLGFPQLLGTPELLPILLSMSSIPSILYISVAYWLPESPYYLIRQGQKDRAISLLKELREITEKERLYEAADCIEKEQASAGNMKRANLRQMFASSGYRRQLFVVVMVFVQAQLCGINAIGSYTNTIYIEAGFVGDSVTIASTITYSVQCLVAFAGSAAIDRFGPRRLNIISGAAMSVSLVILTIALATQHTLDFMRYISVATLTIYVLVWACGINLTLFPMLGSFTTDVTREAAFFFGGGIFWIFSWFVSFMAKYLMEWLNAYAFLPFAVLNAIFLVYVIVCLPETNGKTPAQIQQYIQSGQNNFQKKGNEQFSASKV